MGASVRIGVLSLQGAFELHRPHLEALSVSYENITRIEHLKKCDGLILPGGESTSMLKLLSHQNMVDALYSFVITKPTWGICAGLILLAQAVKGSQQFSFNAIDISVIRNGEGGQLYSHNLEIKGHLVSFIRAPVIDEVGEGVNVLHTKNARPTWVEYCNIMGTTFHPELNLQTPSYWHRRFATLFCGLKVRT